MLQRFGVPCYRYHGKMSASERSKSQDGFMQRGRRTVMVATNAFGLGIDKPDIRYVMHYQAPASLEQYVQEAGRAGRDGRRANCIMLYSPEDRAIHEALLSRSRVRPEQLYKLGRALAAWAGEEKIPSLESLALSAELGTRTTGALLALLEEATLVRWDTTAVFVTVPADEIERTFQRAGGGSSRPFAPRTPGGSTPWRPTPCSRTAGPASFASTSGRPRSTAVGCATAAGDRTTGPRASGSRWRPPKTGRDRDRKRRSTRGKGPTAVAPGGRKTSPPRNGKSGSATRATQRLPRKARTAFYAWLWTPTFPIPRFRPPDLRPTSRR